jgi:hypothetical protein
MLGCVGTPGNVTSVYGSITGAQIELARKVVAVRRALTPDYRRVFDAMTDSPGEAAMSGTRSRCTSDRKVDVFRLGRPRVEGGL